MNDSIFVVRSDDYVLVRYRDTVTITSMQTASEFDSVESAYEALGKWVSRYGHINEPRLVQGLHVVERVPQGGYDEYPLRFPTSGGQLWPERQDPF